MGSASSATACVLSLWVPSAVTHRDFSLRVRDIKSLIRMETVTYLGEKKTTSVWLEAGIFFRVLQSMFLIAAAEVSFRSGFDPAIEWSGKGN